MQRVIQGSLAIVALLLALVLGPETHVHQGEGSNRETVVHAHFGAVGHVHSAGSSGPGFSRSDANGPAVYLNAYSSVERRATAVPILIPQSMDIFVPTFAAAVTSSEPDLNAHSPPLIDSAHPRPPPLVPSA